MSPPLSRPRKTFLVIVSAGCLALPLLQAGCDGDADAADREVREHLAAAQEQAEAGVSAAPGVPEAYKKAVAVGAASPVAKVEALTRLADAERDRAVALMAEADRLEAEMLRLAGASNQQAARIQSNNTLAAGLAQLEPTKATQAIEQQRGAALGEQNPVWIEHETGPIHAQKGLEDQAGQLEGSIAELEGQSKDMAAQRSKRVGEAEQLEKQSDQAQGAQSAELFNQSVDARKQAADLGVQVEALDAKLLPLRQDLERVQANRQTIAKTIEMFGGQLQLTRQNWAKVQEQIAELQKLNQQIHGGANETAPAANTTAAAAPVAPSIVGKLRQINERVAQIDAKRSEAESLLKGALEKTGAAASSAATLVGSMSAQMSEQGAAQRPERTAWQRLSELHNPSRFKLRQATLQILLADIYRARAANLAVRANLQQVLAAALQPAKLSVPPEAGGANLKAESDAAKAASLAQYGEAETVLRDVIEASRSNDMMGEASKGAQLMQLVRLYAQAQADPQMAGSLAASARQLAAAGEQVNLPASALPSFVQDALELRAPPATGPATRPAGPALPAGGTAPAPGSPDPATNPGDAPPGTVTPPPAPSPETGSQPAPVAAPQPPPAAP